MQLQLLTFDTPSGEFRVNSRNETLCAPEGTVVKNPPARAGDAEVRVPSLRWKDPLEEEVATHSSILAWRIPLDGGAWWDTVHGVVKSRMQLSTCTFVHTHTHTAHTCSRMWNRSLNS